MTIVKLTLREPCPTIGPDGQVVDGPDGRTLWVYPSPDEVDLDRLSPRARALAEAVAATHTRDRVAVAIESDRPIREIVPTWQALYTAAQADQCLRGEFRAWDQWPADREQDPHAYLERQAAKIPAGWHPVGQWPAYQPTPTQDTGMTTAQVIATLRGRGVVIAESTWRSYVSRGQAPAPVRRVGSTPLWDPADVVEWLGSRPGQGARTDLT